MKGIMPGLRLETWDYRASGNTVTCSFRNSADIYRKLGVDFVDGASEAIFRGDKIEAFLTYSAESVQKLWAAQEEDEE